MLWNVWRTKALVSQSARRPSRLALALMQIKLLLEIEESVFCVWPMAVIGALNCFAQAVHPPTEGVLEIHWTILRLRCGIRPPGDQILTGAAHCSIPCILQCVSGPRIGNRESGSVATQPWDMSKSLARPKYRSLLAGCPSGRLVVPPA
jgi:hypothetical protein